MGAEKENLRIPQAAAGLAVVVQISQTLEKVVGPVRRI